MIAASASDQCQSRLPRSSTTPIVYVVDADPAVRESLETLIRLAGWRPEVFASAEEFLSRPRGSVASCVVLDATLPSLGALEVQRRIAAEHPELPIIFVTDCADTAITVKAMKAGAAEFFMKPLVDDVLVSALRQSIAQSADALAEKAELQALRDRYAELSGREREVMALVVSGQLNKQVGGELGISEITVKAHRGKVMRKMKAKTFVDLMHMAARLDVGPLTSVGDPTWSCRHSGSQSPQPNLRRNSRGDLTLVTWQSALAA